MAPKALLCWEKSPLLVPVEVLPNRLVEVALGAPKPKPVLVEEVAGWLNVLDPNRPPGEPNRDSFKERQHYFIQRQ